ncbi:NADH-quinone oxidoreductase subunit H [Thermococcus aggregans]|uniref:NADH-quinone oxidoreductase subunit H n=1 Tax=Thermococcus aggregans TaxID=110163 RepID=A0A9E7MXW8_THEAG|nr:NADH-quinone oxidoreductase subunit H [Thermococcus aggregans]USS40890.1 NADH-quinone oxidoreductase subunit H [Thermococcus aggregans]
MELIGAIIAPFLPPLLDGIARKVRAMIQNRVGPSIFQTWYDIITLLSMDSILPTSSLAFRLAPYLALASALCMALMLPYGSDAIINFGGDLIAFIYVFTLFSAALVFGALSVDNSYSHAGANRELTLSLVFKPLFAITIGIFALKTGSLSITEIAHSVSPSISIIGAYLLLLYVTYVESGFIPYDIAEAETEILEGPLTEYSGRLLGLLKWALQIKRFAMIWLFASFVALPVAEGAIAFVLQLLVFLLTYLLMVTYESLNARYRLDQATKQGVKGIVIGVILMIIAWLGW